MPDRSPPPAPHLGPRIDESSGRLQFSPQELAVVLSHYDLGVISSVREYPRGSRRSPKARIESERGTMLLKRRAQGRDDPSRVAFAHALQIHLEDLGFPVAGLIGTRRDNNSLLRLGEHTYEMFRYIDGGRRDPGTRTAGLAGASLGHLHRLLSTFDPPFAAPTGSFHGATHLAAMLEQVPTAVTAADGLSNAGAVSTITKRLGRVYADASDRVEQLGFADWPQSNLHGDWHPGNLLFGADRERVAAVLDFDAARRENRMADLANGALQFSMRMTDLDDPSSWPDALETASIQAFVRGYDSGSAEPLGPEELAALPWLMLEAMILETIMPIATTGRFGHLQGEPFLDMVDRKVKWLAPRAEKLVQYISSRDASSK